jgi:transcriptional regulator with XRE-family HTH domain
MLAFDKPNKTMPNEEQNQPPSPVKYAVAQRIKTYRELRRITQETMAETLGVSQQTYSRIETGITELTLTKIHEIAQILKVMPEEIYALDSQYVKALLLPKFTIDSYRDNVEFEAYLTTIKRQETTINNLLQELQAVKDEKAALLEQVMEFKKLLIMCMNKIGEIKL